MTLHACLYSLIDNLEDSKLFQVFFRSSFLKLCNLGYQFRQFHAWHYFVICLMREFKKNSLAIKLHVKKSCGMSLA